MKLKKSTSPTTPSREEEGDSVLKTSVKVDFYGGAAGTLLPFILFITGVIIVALSGAPDEKGFWPILILALTAGLLLAKERRNYCQSVIEGMSQPIVMIMITAWMLASIIGVMMSDAGFVEALTWTAGRLHLGGPGFVILAFLICCLVAVSTGSSFGTILICGPILFPAGGLLGAHTATLAGAIIGGATFGDCIAPISDTTIASALSQNANIGGTVRSRLKYILPVGAAAILLYAASAGLQGRPAPGKFSETTKETAVDMSFPGETAGSIPEPGKSKSSGDSGLKSSPVPDTLPNSSGNPRGLPMLLVPVVIIFLLLKGRHLLHGLLFGLLAGIVIALPLHLIPLDRLFSLDTANFTARSLIIDGINRAVGISFFTILLMGLVATLKSSGILQRMVEFSARHSRTVKHTEAWITGAVGSAVLLTTHSIVAVLTVGEFAREAGEKIGIHRYRRANLLSLTVCTFPFLLPYFIPVILMANTTASGAPYNIPPVPPLQAGLYNFTSWGILVMVLLAVFAGYGRKSDSRIRDDHRKPELDGGPVRKS